MSELRNVIEKLAAETQNKGTAEQASKLASESASGSEESTSGSESSEQKKKAESEIVANLIKRSKYDHTAALELAYLFRDGHLVPESIETAIEYANYAAQAAGDLSLQAEAYLLLFNLYVLMKKDDRSSSSLEEARIRGNPDTELYKAHRIFWGEARFVEQYFNYSSPEKTWSTSHILSKVPELLDMMDIGTSEYSSNPNIKIVRAIKSLTTDSFNFDSILRAFSPGFFFRGPFIPYDGPMMQMNCQTFKCRLQAIQFIANQPPKLRDVVLMIPNGNYYTPSLMSRCAPPHPNIYGPIGYTSNVNQYRDSGERFVTPFALVTTELSESITPLIEKIKTEPSFLKDHFIPFMLDILEGLAHLHRNNVVHRTVSPEYMRVKSNGSGLLLTGDGSNPPSLPELEKNRGYSRTSDVFSLGVSILSLLCSASHEPALPLVMPKLLFLTHSKEIKEYFEKIKSLAESGFASIRDQIPEWCPKGLLDFIAHCLELDHRKRPTLSELIEYFKTCLPKETASKTAVGSKTDKVEAPLAYQIQPNFPYQIEHTGAMHPRLRKENLRCCVYGGYNQFWMHKWTLLLEDRYTANKQEQKAKGEAQILQSKATPVREGLGGAATSTDKASVPSPKYANLLPVLLLEVGKFLGANDYLSYCKSSKHERDILLRTARGQVLLQSSIISKLAVLPNPLEVPEITRRSLQTRTQLTEILFRIIKAEKDITSAFNALQAANRVIEATHSGWGHRSSMHSGQVAIEKNRTTLKTTQLSCPSCIRPETYQHHLSPDLTALAIHPFMSCKTCKNWTAAEASLLWGFNDVQLATIPSWTKSVEDFAESVYCEAVLTYFRKKYPLECAKDTYPLTKDIWKNYPCLPAFVKTFVFVKPEPAVKDEKEKAESAQIKPEAALQGYLVMYQKSLKEDSEEEIDVEKDEAEAKNSEPKESET